MNKNLNKRQLSAIKTREKIVNATLALAKEKGLKSININDIVRKAGVSHGSFYVYFKRKEDIILEFGRKPFNKLFEELNNMQNKPFIERLSYYFSKFMEAIETYSINVTREWIRDVINPNDVQDSQDGQKWQYDFDMLKSIIDTAVKNNELKENTPVEFLTHSVISQLYGMMLCWCMSDKKFEPLDWLSDFKEIQLKGMFEPYIVNNPDKK